MKKANEQSPAPASRCFYLAARKVFRICEVITPAEAKERFGKLKSLGVNLNSIDDIEILYFIKRPEKRGGRMR